MIDVSIIIVNYNSKKILRDCLESFYNNSAGFTYEIIVVDNSDKEDAWDLLEHCDSVKYIKNNVNAGFAAANNQGIRIAEGRYILFLNNDTLFTVNTIKIIKDFCDLSSEELMVGCKLLNSDGSHQHSLVEFDNLWNSFTENFFLYKLFPRSKYFNKYFMNYYSGTDPVETEIIKGAFMFCSGKLIKELNGFDERFYFYSEENDLCYRFKKNGGKVIFFPGTSIIHLGGASADKIPWFSFKNKSISKILYYKKYYTGMSYITLLILHYCGILIRFPIYSVLGVFTWNKKELLRSGYYLRQLTVFPNK